MHFWNKPKVYLWSTYHIFVVIQTSLQIESCNFCDAYSDVLPIHVSLITKHWSYGNMATPKSYQWYINHIFFELAAGKNLNKLFEGAGDEPEGADQDGHCQRPQGARHQLRAQRRQDSGGCLDALSSLDALSNRNNAISASICSLKWGYRQIGSRLLSPLWFMLLKFSVK